MADPTVNCPPTAWCPACGQNVWRGKPGDVTYCASDESGEGVVLKRPRTHKDADHD